MNDYQRLTEAIRCSNCNGLGTIEAAEWDWRSSLWIDANCGECGGNGLNLNQETGAITHYNHAPSGIINLSVYLEYEKAPP